MLLPASQMYVTSHYLTINPAVMKRLLLFSAVSLTLFSACSTAYKSGQTPDDVYYSPGREVAATASRNDQRQQDEYQEYISSSDDRYLRMKVANRSRWSSLDDFDYWYDSRYDFSNYSNYSSYSPWCTCFSPFSIGFSRYSYWGSGYGNYGYYGWGNPYYTVMAYGSPKFSNPGSTSGSNLSAYRNREYFNSNFGQRDKNGNYTVPGNASFGNLLRRVFTTSPQTNTNPNSTSYDRPARTFDNNSRSSSSGSSSSGGTSGGFKSSGSSTSTGRGGRG